MLLNSHFYFHYESVLLRFAFYLKVLQNRKDSNVKMSIRHTYAPGNKTKEAWYSAKRTGMRRSANRHEGYPAG